MVAMAAVGAGVISLVFFDAGPKAPGNGAALRFGRLLDPLSLDMAFQFPVSVLSRIQASASNRSKKNGSSC